MKMKKTALISAIILVFSLFVFTLFPSFAAAQRNYDYQPNSNYVVIKLGGYSPVSNELTGYDTGFNGEAAFGHYFNRYFATELGVGHLQTSGTAFCVALNAFCTEDIDATYVEATAKAVFPVPYYYSRGYGPLMDFYLGGGVGVYFANDNVDAIDFHRSDTVPGFQILGGTDFNLNRNVFLGLELKYMYAKPFDTDIEGMIFTGNIGFRF